MSLQSISSVATIQLTVGIKCPKCGQDGALLWERRGRELYLANLSPGFYECVAKRPPFRIELVCDGCGVVQPTTGKPRQGDATER